MKNTLSILLSVVLIVSFFSTTTVKADAPVLGYKNQFPTEEATGYLVAKEMPVMVFPLNSDFFYNYYSSYINWTPSMVQTYTLSGVELGYKNLYLAPDPDNPTGYVRYTVFYHTEGSKLLAVGIYDRGALDKDGKYVPNKSYYSSDVRTVGKPVAEHSVLGKFYPNKILNDLEAAQAILDYQNENGPFVAGQEYSMLDILNLKGRHDYVLGKTSSGQLVTGGGVCVMVTDWMKLLALEDSKVIEKWEHPDGQKYFENPVGAAELPIAGTDATVEWPDYDLRWVQKETGWVTISVSVVPDGDELKSEYGEDDIKYDAMEIVTMRFTAQKPDLSTDKFEALQTAYKNYRAGDAGRVALTVGGSKMTDRFTWKYGDATSQLLSQIVPQERINDFSSELNTDPFLKSLVELRFYANQVDPTSDTRMGTYLKSTPWYTDELVRLGSDSKRINKLNDALDHLDVHSNYWKNQKIQCVGLSVLISAMDNRFPNIGGINFDYASQLVPEEIRNGKMIVVNKNGMLVKAVTDIDEINVGDMGVRYDTKAGHVFSVVGKKTLNGETVLLIASANQASDGRITIFEVDKSNFDAVFGIPDLVKVVLVGTN